MDRLSNEQIAAAGLADWRKLAQALHARFRAADRASATAFLTAVGRIETDPERHLELRLTGAGATVAVEVAVGTRSQGLWVTPADLQLAGAISALAGQCELSPDPAGVTQLEVGLDTADDARVGPFWSALLTGAPDNTLADTVLDPTGRVPNVWFQGTAEHAVPRQRWHFDLWLAPETAADRIAAAVAAGGTVVDDSQAPSFVVLADPDGNRACVCTSLDRD